MSKDNETYNQLISIWGIQDALLQSYRSIFITAESILVAISVTMISLKTPIFCIIFSILGFYVLCLWQSICNARALDVSFIQWLLLKMDSDGILVEKPVDAFKQWQIDKTFKEVNVLTEENFIDMVAKSETRTKMEVKLPKVFKFMWILLVIFSFFYTAWQIYHLAVRLFACS